MVAASQNVIFPGHNHVALKVSGHQYRWLAGGFELEIGEFWKWVAWWLPLRSVFI